jgi:hypothetical protein
LQVENLKALLEVEVRVSRSIRRVDLPRVLTGGGLAGLHHAERQRDQIEEFIFGFDCVFFLLLRF